MPKISRHILIVEDNEDNRDMLRALLELQGHRVELAKDGPEGLEKALSTRPEVALIDVGLPGLSGYEVAQQIRTGLDGGQMFLIALTGYGQPEDVRRSRDAGFDAHLVKPLPLAELTRLLAVAGEKVLSS